MSDKPISKGDLVMVVKPCPCGCTHLMGKVFKVGDFRQWGSTMCRQCQRTHPGQLNAFDDAGNDICGVWRLKRLDPDALKDDVPTGDELTV